jgi:hypothetical protein
MSGNLILAGAAVGLAAAALGAVTAAPGVPMAGRTRQDLEAVARRAIFFGHQSVGMNLLDGVQKLAAQEGMALRVVDVTAAPSAAPSTISHLFVEENGNPARKLQDFARAMGAVPPSSPDIALVKFCYVDFTSDTDARALLARYRATVSELQAQHPGTRFVHVTAALSTVQTGPKAWAKRLLGKTPYGLAENARREDFNALLREAYAGREPLFDLARVESTLPDGSPATVSWKGRNLPVLADAYTDDGGHLNEEGRLRAARELVSILAAVPYR